MLWNRMQNDYHGAFLPVRNWGGPEPVSSIHSCVPQIFQQLTSRTGIALSGWCDSAAGTFLGF